MCQSTVLLHLQLVQVAAPEQSLEGEEAVGMQQDTLLAVVVWLAPAQGTAQFRVRWTQAAPPGMVLFLQHSLLPGQEVNGHQLASSSSCSFSLPSYSLDLGGRGISEQLDLVLSPHEAHWL